MSIDSLIDDKKDALASSGRPLNQGVGPDLIEVLATRKLLEEKAMAARDMALKQQNIPNTIAEQQEQKLLGLTQKEVANQTGGIMQQRAQQQQRPQQRPATGWYNGCSSSYASRCSSSYGWALLNLLWVVLLVLLCLKVLVLLWVVLLVLLWVVLLVLL